MSSKWRQRSWWLLAGALTLVAGDAYAVVGRPLTPVSYAGVARRTVRRSAAVGVAAGAAATQPVGGAAPVTTLPPGCAPGVACGGVTYQPAYSGTTVVYTPQ